MKGKKEGENTPPLKKWVARVYGLMAAGRYAALWGPELWEAYKLYFHEDGEHGANQWLMRELVHSVGPALGIRLYRVLRVFYAAYMAYRKLAGE